MPKPKEHVTAVDRHAARVAGLGRAVFDSPGASDRATRAAAAAAEGLPPPLGAYVAKVSGAAYRIVDADIAALKTAGYGEEEIFEVTVAAAVGAALRSLDAGMRAVRGRPEDAARDT
jgi:alkylhydroperoxidase family enzyme